MFKNYSTEQFAHIVTVISVIVGVSIDDLNTTFAVIFAIVAVLMQAFAYIRRFGRGDLTLGGFRE